VSDVTSKAGFWPFWLVTRSRAPTTRW